MTNWDFACSDPVDISVDSWGAGSVVVSGEPTSALVVEVVPSHRRAAPDDLLEQIQVEFEDGQLYVRGPRVTAFRRKQGLDLSIKAPPGSTCAAKTVSADLSCVGEISAVTLQTASGDFTAASIGGDVTVKSASGDVLLDRAAGALTVQTASGDVKVTQVDGDIRINSASGDVTIGSCAGPAAVRTASGDVRFTALAAGRIELASASGDLAVAVVPGVGVYLDLSSNSGDIRSELDPGDGDEHEDASSAALQLSCRTWSGDIQITKARGVPSSQHAMQQ